MRNYLLSILGAVLIGCLLDVILPDGKLNKFVKSIFSIFLLAVIIVPLTNLVNTNNIEAECNSYFDSGEATIYTKMVESKENYIESVLKDNGFDGVDIKLLYDIENDDIHLKSCCANINDLVIDLDKQNINKYEYIREIINNCTNLSNEEIEIDE